MPGSEVERRTRECQCPLSVSSQIFFFLSLLCLLGLQYEGPEAPVYEVRFPSQQFWHCLTTMTDLSLQPAPVAYPHKYKAGHGGIVQGRCSPWSGCGEGFQSYTKLRSTTVLDFALGEGSRCHIPSCCLCDLWQQKRGVPCFPPLSVAVG